MSTIKKKGMDARRSGHAKLPTGLLGSTVSHRRPGQSLADTRSVNDAVYLVATPAWMCLPEILGMPASVVRYRDAAVKADPAWISEYLKLFYGCVEQSSAATDPAPEVAVNDLDAALDRLDPEATPARDADNFREIIAARKRLAEAEAELRAAVKAARNAGDSWTVIGAALDTSRQAAFQRFGKD